MMPDLFRDEVFQIETRRLWLRWPCAADQSDICAYAGDRRVAEFTAEIPHPYLPEHAGTYVADSRLMNAGGHGISCSIEVKGAARVIGGLSIRNRDGRYALGYALGPLAWGQGFATEAAAAIVDAYFRFCPHGRLWATALPENAASRRVLEKIGFVGCGRSVTARPARGDEVEVEGYDLTRTRWLAHRGFAAHLPWGAYERRAA